MFEFISGILLGFLIGGVYTIKCIKTEAEAGAIHFRGSVYRCTKVDLKD